MDVMELAASVDVGWTLVAAALVFFMQAGLRWWRPALPARKTRATSS